MEQLFSFCSSFPLILFLIFWSNLTSSQDLQPFSLHAFLIFWLYLAICCWYNFSMNHYNNSLYLHLASVALLLIIWQHISNRRDISKFWLTPGYSDYIGIFSKNGPIKIFFLFLETIIQNHTISILEWGVMETSPSLLVCSMASYWLVFS